MSFNECNTSCISMLGLLDPEDKGTVNLRNARKYSPDNKHHIQEGLNLQQQQ